MDKALHCLKKYWGHQEFRHLQTEIITSVLQKDNVLAILPTGAGKSICYQIPALLNKGICLVISPLIALMEDQIDSLEKRGIKALQLSGGMNQNDTVTAFDNLLYGNYKFLYLSPEKMESELVREKLRDIPINLIAIDEAHCISQWGHDFRPSYLRLSELGEILPNVPIIALTATATKQVEIDIIEQLGLKDPVHFRSSIFRQNLSIGLVKTENPMGKLKQILSQKNEPSIVYVGRRKESIIYSDYLNTQGISAAHYHGGMDRDERSKVLNDWLDERTRVVVATNAFGMGIDKDNVRSVIHCHLPLSLESYVQEIGRAGRDGKPSYAYMLFNDYQVTESKNLLENSKADPKFCRDLYIRLNEYLKISPGEISDSGYRLDISEFCQIYHLPLAKSYSALGHLERENVIRFAGNPKRESRVILIDAPRNVLDRSESSDFEGRLLQVLLRNYGGIYEQKIRIKESFLANKLGASKHEIIRSLNLLSKLEVLKYDESHGMSELFFLMPREDKFVYHSIKNNISARNQVKKMHLSSVHTYIMNASTCRNRQLVDYFGEKDIENCGLCDNCRKNDRSETSLTFAELAERIQLMLKEHGELDFNQLTEIFATETKTLSKTLELMVEKGRIKLNLRDKFELIS